MRSANNRCNTILFALQNSLLTEFPLQHRKSFTPNKFSGHPKFGFQTGFPECLMSLFPTRVLSTKATDDHIVISMQSIEFKSLWARSHESPSWNLCVRASKIETLRVLTESLGVRVSLDSKTRFRLVANSLLPTGRHKRRFFDLMWGIHWIKSRESETIQRRALEESSVSHRHLKDFLNNSL